MLVPNPKNAFQSPAVHKAGRFVSDAIGVMTRSSPIKAPSQPARSPRSCLGELEGEAGHPDPEIAEVHHDPSIGTSGLMGETLRT
jgi:hypothetical protein